MAESLWIIPFGKHKNSPIEDVPTHYLEWLTEQDWFLTKFPTGADRVGQELAFRDRFESGLHPDEDRGWNRRNK
jgi:uncharacterized protein (DUF3820 family)